MRTIGTLAVAVAFALIGLATIVPQYGSCRIGHADLTRAMVAHHLPAMLDLFKHHVGRYPTSEEGLAALVERPASVSADAWRGPYARKSEDRDAWGTFVRYACCGRGGAEYELRSSGANGVFGDADDIVNR